MDKYPSLTIYRVYFDDGAVEVYNLAADITLEKAEAYYVGKTFNIGSDENEKFHKGVKVEQIRGPQKS